MDQEALEVPTITVDQGGQMDSGPEAPEVQVDQEVQADQDTPQAVQEGPEIHTDHQTEQEHGIFDHPRDIT